MACFHPLKAFIIGKKNNNKNDLCICSYTTDHIEKHKFNSNIKWIPCESSNISPYSLDMRREYIEIPCGKCVGCREMYARQWADRCIMELEDHDESWFLTLTYDEKHVHVNEAIDPDTGQLGYSMTLCRKDLQDFFKRVRNHTKFRYFGSGEYGSQTQRPHYHMIAFGLHIPDMKVYQVFPDGKKLYVSKWLDELWTHGSVKIAEANWQTAAYTAKYITKKLYGHINKERYELLNMQPEFSFMSTKPGIGKNYYDTHHVFEHDNFFVSTLDGARPVFPPRYFKKLLERDDVDKYNEIVDKSLADAKRRVEVYNSLSELDYLDVLRAAEAVKTSQNRTSRNNFVKGGFSLEKSDETRKR